MPSKPKPIDHANAQLDRSLFFLEGDPIPVRLTNPVEVEWSRDLLEVRGLRAAVLGGEIAADLSVGDAVNIELRAEGLDLAKLEPDARGKLALVLRVAGPTDAPEASLTASVPEVSWGPRMFRKASGRTEEGIRRRHGSGLHELPGPRYSGALPAL